nr:hypothetical protein Iba_chr13aCG8230 [Ipomoea batatas]
MVLLDESIEANLSTALHITKKKRRLGAFHAQGIPPPSSGSPRSSGVAFLITAAPLQAVVASSLSVTPPHPRPPHSMAESSRGEMKRKGKSPMKHASHSAESNPATVDELLYWSEGRENIYLHASDESSSLERYKPDFINSEAVEKNQQRALVVQRNINIDQFSKHCDLVELFEQIDLIKKYTTKSPNLFLSDLTVLLLFALTYVL